MVKCTTYGTTYRTYYFSLDSFHSMLRLSYSWKGNENQPKITLYRLVLGLQAREKILWGPLTVRTSRQDGQAVIP